MNLADEEHRICTRLHEKADTQVPEPDLVVWLQATPATPLQRIRTRGIGMAQRIDEEYLQRLCDAYVQHFQGYDGAPVFAVVTDRFNPLDRPADFELLLSRLGAFEARRAVLDACCDDGDAPTG